MGFLHKLWDETFAGPIPDAGLSKLRKFDSVNASITRTTRTITVLRPNSNFRSFSSDSASDSDPSRTPLTRRTPGGEFKKFARRKSSAQPPEQAVSTTPTDFYWVMMSALDG